MARLRVIDFIAQVKQEAAKITWPSRKETLTSAAVVIVMVTVFSGFFLVVDIVVHYVIQAVLGFGSL